MKIRILISSVPIFFLFHLYCQIQWKRYWQGRLQFASKTHIKLIHSCSRITALLFLLIISSIATAQTQWYKYPGNPVLNGMSDEWDNTIMPQAVIFENDQYCLWYKGWKSGIVGFGYATSRDGVHWKKYEGNPLEFKCEGVSWDTVIYSFDILKKDSLYYMWYTGRSKKDNTGWIGFAWSADGLSWTKHQEPVLKPSKDDEWDAWGLDGAQVLFDGVRYHMWYNGNAAGIPVIGRAGYATSNDGIYWKKHPSNPVLDVGEPGSWEDHTAMVEAVEFNGTYFEMWYYGWNLVQHEIGYASSYDGVNWKKSSENPVVRAGEVGSWDSWLTTYPAILLRDSVCRMWYYGHDNAQGSCGYATTSAQEALAWEVAIINKPQKVIKVNVFNRTEYIKVDSLAEILPGLSGTVLIDTYNKLALAYSLNDNAKSYLFAGKALNLAEKIHYPEGKAMALYCKGNSQYVMDNYSDALANQLSALRIFDSLDMKYEVGNLLSQIASIYSYIGLNDLARNYYEKALKVFEEINDTGFILQSLIYLGYSNLWDGDTISAIKAFQRRLSLAKENKNIWKEVDSYEALGLCYTGRKLDSALYYFNVANIIWDSLQQRGYQGHNFMITAEAYCAAGSEYYDLAEKDFLKCYEQFGNGRQMQVRLLYGMAELYFNTGRYDKTREFLDVTLHMCRNFLTKQNHRMFTYLNQKMEYERLLIPYMEKIYRLYYQLDTALNNETSAFQNYILATQWKDSIYNEQSRRQMAMLQGEYETESVQNHIAILEKENEVKNLTLKKSKIYLFGLSALVLIIVIGAIIFIRNRRVRAQHAIELERVKSDKLKELDHLRSRFFANISHEFRTPLTLILGPLEKILSKTSGETERKELNIARKYANRLQYLINQILSISKLESGKMQLHAAEINIVKLISNYLQSFESLAKQKGIAIYFTCENSEILAFVDKEKFEQILNNLLSNAFKFTAEGGEIKVGVERIVVQPDPFLEWDGRAVQITISDTGHGIPPEHINHVFDRYYQVERTDGSYLEGTGIGLALTKELVELHHGTIKVESDSNQEVAGTIFTILLPLEKDQLKPEEIIEGQPEDIITQPVKETPMDIEQYEVLVSGSSKENDDSKSILLIVEDNADMRSYIRGYFEGKFQIIEAIDGFDGFVKSLEHIPDIIISDVMMPGMDGNELCKKVKNDERTCHIPVVLLTARASKESRIHGLERGADDFITKPFDGEELKVRVTNLISQRIKLQDHYRKDFGTDQNNDRDKVLSSDERFLKKAKSIVEQNLSNPEYTVEDFAFDMALSRNQLHRKLRALVNNSCSEFIRTIRLNYAAYILRKKTGSISEIAYDSGFNNPTWFSESFRQQFGMSPTEYQIGNHTS